MVTSLPTYSTSEDSFKCKIWWILLTLNTPKNDWTWKRMEMLVSLPNSIRTRASCGTSNSMILLWTSSTPLISFSFSVILVEYTRSRWFKSAFFLASLWPWHLLFVSKCGRKSHKICRCSLESTCMYICMCLYLDSFILKIMQVMGMRHSVVWIVWLAISGATMITLSFILTFILKWGGITPLSDPLLIFFLLFGYSLSLLSYWSVNSIT